MPLPVPQIDRRSFQEILDETLARVPVHTPEWTHLGDSDPGVTLLQLFAFMVESLLYRANRVPERNRLKFLRLLGVPLQPATSARGLVAFSNPRGPGEPIVLEPDLEVLAGKVPFRTDNGLQVLPVEARLYYKRRLVPERAAEVADLYRRLYASFDRSAAKLDLYETQVFEPAERGVVLPLLDLAADTLDGLWLALLARPDDTVDDAREALGGSVLTVGLVPDTGEEGECILRPRGNPAAAGRPRLTFEIPDPGRPGPVSTPFYRPLPVRADGDLLSGPGVVEISLPPAEELVTWQDLDPLEAGTGAYPPALEETEDEARLVTWLRIRAPRPEGLGGAPPRVALAWLGINAARVSQRSRVDAELLPRGTGEPDQSATLVQTPVLPETLRLTVNGEPWRRIDDLAAAPPEVPARGSVAPSAVGSPASAGGSSEATDPRVFALDAESGVVTFGTGHRGARPPRGSILVASYAWGGGRQGLVGIGAIDRGPELPDGIKVTNPVPSWGADDGEATADAERRVSAFLRHRDRAVAASDVKEITERTPGVELGRVEVEPLLLPSMPDQPAEGVVTVLVIPRHDPEQPAAPRPSTLFLETVCAYLEPRRVLTTELHVRGPEYVGLWVSVGIEPVPGRDEGPVRERVRRAVERFLSPLEGGFEGRGWPLRRAVEALELQAAAARVDGVASVTRLLLGNAAGDAVDRLPLQGLELPRLLGLAVQSGDPLPLADLRGASPEAPLDPPRLPVPVVPEEC